MRLFDQLSHYFYTAQQKTPSLTGDALYQQALALPLARSRNLLPVLLLQPIFQRRNHHLFLQYKQCSVCCIL